MNDEFNRLWLKYFVQTPWFNEKIIARLYEKFFQAQAALKKSAMKLLAATNGKARTFITVEENLKMLVENFSVRQNEEIIIIKAGTTIQNIIEVMKSYHSKKIFFILLPNFPFHLLENAGFVRGEDFVDCFEFSPKNFNSYPLVAAM